MDRLCRRSVLASGLALLAGCASDERREPFDPPDDPVPPEADGVDVALVPRSYVVATAPATPRLGPGDVVPEAEVPPVLRDALSEAAAGGFETDAASPELRAAIDGFRRADGTLEPYVRLDGTAHVFDPSVPTLVAELGDPVEEYDPGSVARREDAETAAVERFLRTLTVSGTHLPRQAYRASRVPPSVEAFLDRYEYVADARGVSPIETETVDADPPHTITVRELADEDRWGRPVVDASDLDGDRRRFVTDAIESDHRAPATPSPERSIYLTDDVPGGDAGTAWTDGDADDPYVRLDGTVYRVRVREVDHEAAPVTVSAESAPSTSDGRPRITLTVERTADAGAVEVDLADGAPTPLWIEHDGTHHRLEPTETGVRPRATETVVVDELATTYAIPAAVPAGTYVSRGIVRARVTGPDRRGTARYPFVLALSLEGS